MADVDVQCTIWCYSTVGSKTEKHNTNLNAWSKRSQMAEKEQKNLGVILEYDFSNTLSG